MLDNAKIKRASNKPFRCRHNFLLSRNLMKFSKICSSPTRSSTAKWVIPSRGWQKH